MYYLFSFGKYAKRVGKAPDAAETGRIPHIMTSDMHQTEIDGLEGFCTILHLDNLKQNRYNFFMLNNGMIISYKTS